MKTPLGVDELVRRAENAEREVLRLTNELHAARQSGVRAVDDLRQTRVMFAAAILSAGGSLEVHDADLAMAPAARFGKVRSPAERCWVLSAHVDRQDAEPPRPKPSGPEVAG